VFRPSAEGEAVDSVVIHVASTSTPLVVYLKGRGVVEKIAADRVDFGCVEMGRDTTIPVVVRNDGSAPLVITELRVDNPTAFSVAALAIPDTIAAGGFSQYPVTFRPAGGRSRGTLSVVNSTGVDYPVALIGIDCKNERTLSVTLPDTTTADIGTTFYLPILADLNAPLDQDVSYSLTMIFEPGLLRPLGPVDHAGNPGAEPRTDGTLSSAVGMEEKRLGEVEIRGTIRAGATSNTLVGIPMRVLLSNVSSTHIKITGLTFTSGGVRAAKLGSGLFVATDCDTSRHIVTGAGKYTLTQNYPNPASAMTVIEYRVPYAERTTINLYDETGTFLRTLVDQINEPGVLYTLKLDRTDLHSGSYYYEMISGYTRLLRRMVVVD
jgi:hypothetical protein